MSGGWQGRPLASVPRYLDYPAAGHRHEPDAFHIALQETDPFLDDHLSESPGFVHNCIAHPLLVLCPPLGRWLHQRTKP